MSAGLAVTAAGAIGFDLTNAQLASAATPASAAQVLSQATAVTGDDLAQVKAAWNPQAPWSGYSGDWCAWFVSWLLRNNGIAYEPYVPSLKNQFPASAFHTTPLAGDVVFYGGDHVGLVTTVVGGTAHTVEGNVGYAMGATFWTNSIVEQFTAPWRSDVTFARPNYSGSSSIPIDTLTPIRNNNGMSSLYYTTDATGNLFALAGDGTGAAAWLETRDSALANALAIQHGHAAFLSLASFNNWKGVYLAG